MVKLYTVFIIINVNIVLFVQELVMVIWFVSEFVIRVWSAGCRSRYQRFGGRLHFMRRPLCIVGKTTLHETTPLYRR